MRPGEEPHPLVVGPVLEPRSVEDFEVHEQIGLGSTGVVYRAVHRPLGVEVALKVLRHPLSSDQRHAFLGACRGLRRLPAHPHLVRHHWAGAPDDGPAWTATALCDHSLAHRLAHPPAPAAAEAATLAAGLLRGAAVLHRAGILHRDLRPGKVMVTQGRAALADPVTRLWHDVAPEDGRRVGHEDRYWYRAPEVVAGQEPTPQSDVYSLAVTLRQLLGELLDAGRGGVRGEETMSPRWAVLENLLVRATSHAAGDRPADAVDLLDRFLTATG